MRVLYICDRQACEKCHYPTCRHTTDVRHAANFKPSGDSANTYYMEKESNRLLKGQLKKKKLKIEGDI